MYSFVRCKQKKKLLSLNFVTTFDYEMFMQKLCLEFPVDAAVRQMISAMPELMHPESPKVHWLAAWSWHRLNHTIFMFIV